MGNDQLQLKPVIGYSDRLTLEAFQTEPNHSKPADGY
jgi:hypothetical protein